MLAKKRCHRMQAQSTQGRARCRGHAASWCVDGFGDLAAVKSKAASISTRTAPRATKSPAKAQSSSQLIQGLAPYHSQWHVRLGLHADGSSIALAFADNPNLMCHLGDIFVYAGARADDTVG